MPNCTTYYNDVARTGWFQGTKPGVPFPDHWRKYLDVDLGAAVRGALLVLENWPVRGQPGATHDLVFVVTSANLVNAYEADSLRAGKKTPLWSTQLPAANPETNRLGDGNVLDQSSSSPTVLPDGNVLYGAYTRYNIARGHLVKFNGTTGAVMAYFDFGWDSTPAVFPHGSTYSIVIKDNHYDEEAGFYCNPSGGVSDIVCASTGVPAGPFYITQLNPNLIPEWKFHSTETNSCVTGSDGSLSCVSDHPNGFEWCINAPAIDVHGTVYVESEDGHAYSIPQGHTGVFDMSSPDVQRLFLRLALGAAYTPLSIGEDGKLYTQNGGHLFVIGN